MLSCCKDKAFLRGGQGKTIKIGGKNRQLSVSTRYLVDYQVVFGANLLLKLVNKYYI